MSKKLIFVLLAFSLMLPCKVFAKSEPDALMNRIDQLTRELESVKKQLKDMQAQQKEEKTEVASVSEKVDDFLKDGIGRIKLWGDLRARVDSTRLEQPSYWQASSVTGALQTMSAFSGAEFSAALGPMMPMLSPEQQAQFGQVLAGWDSMNTLQRIQTLNQMLPTLSPELRTAMLQGLGFSPYPSHDPDNDTLYTTRMRLNMQVKPGDNLVFKARLAMYKLWGNESQFATAGGGIFPSNLFTMNGAYAVRPDDARLYVDRAYVNWTNIGGYPFWFSVGRRPTTHGPPGHLREGLEFEERDASPFISNINLAFDGLTVGYQYENPWPGRLRFCYGRGFESGFKDMGQQAKLDDVDFYGFVWDVIDDKDRDLLVILQAFRAEDLFDFPDGSMYFIDNTLPFGYQKVSMTTRTNLGDMYEIGGLVMHKFRNVEWFASSGISIADPRTGSEGMMPGFQNNPVEDPFEGVSLLTNPGGKMKDRTGYGLYAGLRIPIEQLKSKVGFEYNYGSKYWTPFNISADDIYMDKLATRGHVGEVYWIWNLPVEPLSKYAKAFIRVGYQHYWFDYTGSANWLGAPVDIDDLKDDPMNAQFFTPIDQMDNIYGTFEVFF